MTKLSLEKNLIAYLQLAIMSFCFGGIFIAGKVMANEIPPAQAGFLRFSMASTCLLALLYWRERRFPVPTFKEWAGLTCLGLTGIFGYNLLLLKALQTVEANHSAAMISCNPALITLISCLVLGERISRLNALGVLISVSGAVIVASKGQVSQLLHFSEGDIFLVGALCCWALYSVIGKHILGSLSALVSVSYAAAIGTLLLFPATLFFTDISQINHISHSSWLALFYLAIPGTVIAFLCFYEGIKAIGVIKAGIFINLTPISTLLLSIPILGEIPCPAMLTGTAMVISGVFLVNLREQNDAT